jgi:hypothetical protein
MDHHRHLLGLINIPPTEPAVVKLRECFRNAGADLTIVPLSHEGQLDGFDAVVCFVDVSDHPRINLIKRRAKSKGVAFALAKRKKADLAESLRRGNIRLPHPELLMSRQESTNHAK